MINTSSKLNILLLTTFLTANSAARAADAEHNNHSHHNYEGGHSHYSDPVGVMGSHTHADGKLMLSYRYGYMEMDGNRDGTDNVSNAQIAAQGFMIAPEKMTMEMHMFGAMYGATDNITFMAMVPYKILDMDHTFVMGGNAGRQFTMESKGFGDTKLSAIYKLFHKDGHSVLIDVGISVPTGSIDKRDVNSVTGASLKLPYPMQLGSGTYDLLPGITYTGSKDRYNWGVQIKGDIRLGENDNDYTLGNIFNSSAWAGYNVNKNINTSFRLDLSSWGDISGADPDLTPGMVPTARTDLRGGTRLDALIGASYTFDEGVLEGHRLAAEAGMPVYQYLDGPQLEVDYRFVLGWQKAF